MVDELHAPDGIQRGYQRSGVGWSAFCGLLDLMPDAIVVADEQGAIRAVNSRAEAVFGYAPNELIGQKVETLLPAALASKHRALRARFNDDPYPRPMGLNRNLVLLRKDAQELPVDISLSPIEVEGAKLVIAVVRDVTERRRAETEIRRMNDELEARVRARTRELEAANEQLEAYAYSVSHELRSPLRLIRGFQGLLREQLHDEVNGPQASNYLKQIDEAVARATQIVDGLLSLARLDHVQLNRVHVDMKALAESVAEDLHIEHKDRGVRITIDLLPPARADAVLVRQVFANLMSNAVKHGIRDHGVGIRVDGEKDSNEVIYRVQDDGQGFDARYAEFLFDPFQRIGEPDNVEGLGIGLTLARRIVEIHGGKIWAEKNEAGGATFSFSLPRTG